MACIQNKSKPDASISYFLSTYFLLGVQSEKIALIAHRYSEGTDQFPHHQNHGWIQREGGRGFGPPPPLKNHKKYRVTLQYWSGSHENHKATKPAFNVEASPARKRNAISMAFRWRADGDPIKAIFGSSIPHQLKKSYQIWTLLDPRMKILTTLASQRCSPPCTRICTKYNNI